MSFFILLNIKIILKNVLICILVLNTKEDILKNVGNQTVAGPQWFPYLFSIKVSEDQQLFGYQHSFVFRTRIKINTGLVQHDSE